MITLTNSAGQPLDREQAKGVKARLGEVYKKSGQSMVEFMAELKALSPKDLADFHGWFQAAGYAVLPLA
jgi:hypothetical protein